MIRLIAIREVREMVRDGRFRVTAGLTVLLLGAAVAAGWVHHSAVNAQHEAARQATRAQWLGQEAKNPHSAAHYGVYAFKPKSELAVVDTGVEAYTGVAAWLEAHKQNEFRYRPAQDRSALQRFGELTAAEVLQTLVPLIIVLAAFTAFAGEREQGTWRQVMSLGVARRDLLAGKAVGIGAGLGLILVPATLVGVLALTLSSSAGSMAASPVRMMVMALGYLLYFAAFLGLALAVSAAASSSRLALVGLLAFWMTNTLIVPRVAADAAGRLHPTPSAADFSRALERDLADPGVMKSRLEARKRELLEEYGVASVEALPVNFTGVSLQMGEEHGNEVFDRHYGRLHDTFEQQNRFLQAMGFVAPLLAVRGVSMAMAGTDFEHHRHFIDAAETYRRGMQRILNDDVFHHQKPGVVYTAGPELWRKVPEFGYEIPPATWAVRRQAVGLVALACWVIAAAIAAWVAVGTTRIDS